MDDLKGFKEVILKFKDPSSTQSVVIEVDKKVAYAYLLDKDNLVGDVWLYNVSDAPTAPEWRDKSKMPFLNPKKYCIENHNIEIDYNSNIKCEWLLNGVKIFLDETLIAWIEKGSKPGWSSGAKITGPLANSIKDKVI